MQEMSAEERLQQGKEAVQDGDKQRARDLLQPLVVEAPENAEAWLWLSGAQTSPAEMAACLRRVLEIEPDNQDALDTMAWLEAKHGVALLQPTDDPASDRTFAMPVATTEDYDQGYFQESQAGDGDAATTATERRSRSRRSSSAQRTSASRHSGSRMYPSSPYARPFERRQLVEYSLAVGGVGILIGLLRLAGQLRPATLQLIRGSQGAITPSGAIMISIATALLHGLALVVVWQVLARTTAAARTDRPGDIADSLGRLAPVFWPGYSLVLALLLVIFSLGASERRWTAVVVIVWIIVIVSLLVSARRLVALYDAFGVDDERRVAGLLRMVLPAVVVGVLGLGLAGLVVRWMVAAI